MGVGGLAIAEGAKVWNRLKSLPSSAELDLRILHAFTTLFARLDARVAAVVEDGIERGAYFLRVKAPPFATDRGHIVAPAQERFIPLVGADRAAIIQLVRDQLRPTLEPPAPAPGAAGSRAELHAAIVHQPERRGEGPGRAGI